MDLAAFVDLIFSGMYKADPGSTRHGEQCAAAEAALRAAGQVVLPGGEVVELALLRIPTAPRRRAVHEEE